MPDCRIEWQSGPVKEYGVNGVQVEQVLQLCINRLESLNKPPYNTRQTSLAITKLQEVVHWLDDRTAERTRRGVEGLNQP